MELKDQNIGWVYGDDFDEIPVRQSHTACGNNVSQKDGGIIGLGFQLRPNVVFVAKKVLQSERFF